MKEIIKKIRSVFNFWVWGRDLSFLKKIRIFELQQCLKFIPKGSRVLDFGAGSGQQALYLTEQGYQVKAIDVASSNYRYEKVYPIQLYDGTNIPYDAQSFDIVFSSNVFEHIKSTEATLSSLHSITTDDARLILVMPSATWRIWTIITDLIRSWHFTRPHGVHSRNVFEEVYKFRRNWWFKKLETYQWTLENYYTNKIFYTGNNIFGPRLSLNIRKIMSSLLGSSCNIFILKKRHNEKFNSL